MKVWPNLVFLRDGQVIRQLARPDEAEVREGFESHHRGYVKDLDEIACELMGLTRWWSKPACVDRLRSSSWPYPEMPMITASLVSWSCRRRAAT